MSNGVIRVLVVDDSLTARKRIAEVLTQADGFEVVGEAPDGKRAIEACNSLRPDIVTMDMMLPIMTGLSATEYIMAHCPTPILIISASTNRGEVLKTHDALAAGAVDVLEKPEGGFGNDWEERLLAKVRTVSRIRVITHPRARLGRIGRADRASPIAVAHRSPTRRSLVAIGASTGGPGALLTLGRALPRDFDLPIVCVLHISASFALSLAEWLGGQLRIGVRYAENGERVPSHGCLIMAPPDQHLEVQQGRFLLTQAPERHSCRPSVDVLFESLARDMGPETIACLLTGMGKDGAEGLLAIKQGGGLTLAQDEESSVVYGMPGEAAALGAADRILPLEEFGPLLGQLSAASKAVPA